MQNIGAVILAAGESSRLGQPKQLLQFRGKSLVRGVVEAAEQAGCSPIVVVTGCDKENTERTPHLHPFPSDRGEANKLRESIVHELRETGATIIENQNWRRGIGTSIRAGVEHAIDNAECQDKEGRFPNRPSAVGKPRLLEAIVLLTCDQPFVEATTIKRLIALRDKDQKAIVASAYSDTLGVPALFDRSCFSELLALDNDSGAKPIILSNPERVAQFPFPEGGIDIDTVEDWEKLSRE